MPRLDAAITAERQSADSVAHELWRQIHESRRFDTRHRIPEARVDDGLLVHGVLGSGFGRIGVDRVLATGQGQFDQLDRRGRNIDTQDLAVFSRK